MIQQQILWKKIFYRNIWQTVRRIDIEIFRVKGLIFRTLDAALFYLGDKELHKVDVLEFKNAMAIVAVARELLVAVFPLLVPSRLKSRATYAGKDRWVSAMLVLTGDSSQFCLCDQGTLLF